MALEAIIARSRQVLFDLDIGHLPPLRSSIDNVVAIATVNTAVIAMREDRTESVLRHQCPLIRFELVASVAAADLGIGRVARVAVVVCDDSVWNRLSRT